jgi:hypothetical protein
MASTSSITNFSRRAILAGAPVAAVGGMAARALAAGATGDARLAILAADYRRTAAGIDDLLDRFARRYGPGAWPDSAPGEADYERLIAHEDRVLTALAGTSPDSVAGLAVKLRVATWCDDLAEARGGEPLETVFLPALRDLERLAAEAAP